MDSSDNSGASPTKNSSAISQEIENELAKEETKRQEELKQLEARREEALAKRD
jgi:hypothetical protein